MKQTTVGVVTPPLFLSYIGNHDCAADVYGTMSSTAGICLLITQRYARTSRARTLGREGKQEELTLGFSRFWSMMNSLTN